MFAALIASLFALLVTAQAQSKCKTKFFGQTVLSHANNDIIQVSLPDVQIARKVMTKNIVVPKEIFKRYVCLTGKHIGTRMTACDYDAVPELTIKDLSNAVVTRASAGSRGCSVFTTIYCKMNWQPGEEDHAIKPFYYKLSY